MDIPPPTIDGAEGPANVPAYEPLELSAEQTIDHIHSGRTFRASPLQVFLGRQGMFPGTASQEQLEATTNIVITANSIGTAAQSLRLLGELPRLVGIKLKIHDSTGDSRIVDDDKELLEGQLKLAKLKELHSLDIEWGKSPYGEDEIDWGGMGGVAEVMVIAPRR